MKWILLLIALVGFGDASYLTWEHFHYSIPPCPAKTVLPILVDCGTVLQSEYSMLMGMPLAMWGMVHYAFLFVWLFVGGVKKHRWAAFLALIQTVVGLLMSGYFVYLQLFVLKAICLYCMLSATASITLFLATWYFFGEQRKLFVDFVFGLLYRKLIKPILFLFDPEQVHMLMVNFGELSFKVWGVRMLTRILFRPKKMEQNVGGLHFDWPIGLAAGFDYEARLTQALPAWGFGFQTIGTVTRLAWQGNDSPRLGRLPKSKSLLVNKGFRNPGAAEIIKKLSGRLFENNVGISIGDPFGEIDPIVETFELFEQSSVSHAYYELNISCPNLENAQSLYDLKRLKLLLGKIDKLKIKRPIFVKMPIEKSDDEFLGLLKEISQHKIVGIVVGNLQKKRTDTSFDTDEIAAAGKGNFSGKPTFERSNHFISLAYKNYGKRLLIIGCGGVFSAQDALVKIEHGASLVQLITGMIFQGPQVVSEIEILLPGLLRQRGYTTIADAVGVLVRRNSA